MNTTNHRELKPEAKKKKKKKKFWGKRKMLFLNTESQVLPDERNLLALPGKATASKSQGYRCVRSSEVAEK